jgi:hypothetical protein
MKNTALHSLLALLLASVLGACGDGRSERELAVSAAALVESGARDEGLAMFAEALARFPGSVELRIRMATVLVEDGRLGQAEELLDEADAIEMRDDEAARLGQVRIAWLEKTADQAAGRVEGIGADADRYREASIQLVQRRGDPADRAALSRFLLENARAAIGRSPLEALTPEAIGEPDLATPLDAERALLELNYLLDENSPLGGRPELGDPAVQEARALQIRLRHIVRGAGFDDRFLTEQRPRLIADGDYDVEREAFIVSHLGPYPPEWPPEPSEELMRQMCQYTVARSTARQFAAMLVERGSERLAGDVAFDVREFEPVDVRSVRFVTGEQGDQFACEFLLPYRTVRRAALLLMDRLAVEQAVTGP